MIEEAAILNEFEFIDTILRNLLFEFQTKPFSGFLFEFQFNRKFSLRFE
jgi:hypothetical protein